MESQIENTNIKTSSFLRTFVVLILVLNSIGFLSALNPEIIGLYMALFVYVPLNFIFLITGLIIIIVKQKRKQNINYKLHYAIVILVPVITTFILIQLIDWFAPSGGC